MIQWLALVPVVEKLISSFFPDPIKRDEVLGQVVSMLTAMDQGQLELNKINAQDSRFFHSGWRPFIGWICAFGILYEVVLVPLTLWLMNVLQVMGWMTVPIPGLPALGETFWALVASMLGMAGFRTYEKMKGITKR